MTFQGRTGVRWRPVQGTSLAPPCSNSKSFGSKCTELKEVLVTLLDFSAPPQWFGARGIAPPLPPRYAPVSFLPSFLFFFFRKIQMLEHWSHYGNWLSSLIRGFSSVGIASNMRSIASLLSLPKTCKNDAKDSKTQVSSCAKCLTSDNANCLTRKDATTSCNSP